MSARLSLLCFCTGFLTACAGHSIQGDFPDYETVSIVTDAALESELRKGGSGKMESTAGAASIGAMSGAMAGLACGPFAPICVAAGAVAGGLSGGLTGYLAAPKYSSRLDLHDFMSRAEADLARQVEDNPDDELICDIENLQVIFANKVYKVQMKESAREAFLAAAYDPLDTLLAGADEIKQRAAALDY